MIRVLAEAAKSSKIVTEKIYKNEPVSPYVLKGETFSFIMKNNKEQRYTSHRGNYYGIK